MKTQDNRAWFLVMPVLILVAMNAVIPLMTVVNYSLQETFGDNLFFWVGTDNYTRVLADPRFHNALLRQFAFTGIILAIEIPLGVAIALAMPRSGAWASVCLVLMALPLLIPWNVVGAMWNIFALPDIGLLGWGLNSLGIAYNYTNQPLAAWFTVVLMDVWHWTSLVVLLALRRPALDRRGVLPRREDRRSVLVGGVPIHPASQDAAGPHHRVPAALH